MRLLKTLFAIVLVPLVVITDFMTAQEDGPKLSDAARLVTQVCREYTREEWHAVYATTVNPGSSLGEPVYASGYERYVAENWGRTFSWGSPESLSHRESVHVPPNDYGPGGQPSPPSEDSLTNNAIQGAWRDAYIYFQRRVRWIMANLFNPKDPIALITWSGEDSIDLPIGVRPIFVPGVPLTHVLDPFQGGTVEPEQTPGYQNEHDSTGDPEHDALWEEWRVANDTIAKLNASQGIFRAQAMLSVEAAQLSLSLRSAAANMCTQADPTGLLRDDLTLLADQITGVAGSLRFLVPEPLLENMEYLPNPE